MKQFQSMVRKLLAERFGLVMHTEQRELPVYVLALPKGGPKMTKSQGDPDGLPNDEDHRNGRIRSTQMKNATMGEFALNLMFYTDRPVVYRTGLSGRWDLTLKWTFDDSLAPTDGSAASSLFTASRNKWA